MRFAFSASDCPACDADTLVARAKAYGYAGVEWSADNALRSDPPAVRRTFEAGGVEIACLASSMIWKGRAKDDARAADELRRVVDVAELLRCGRVTVPDGGIRPGQGRRAVAAELGRLLLPVADYASERGVMILVENGRSLRTAGDLWVLLEAAGSPALGSCWNLFNATAAGESSALSVPTLNSRIQYARVRDAKLLPTSVVPCPLGEGDVPVEKFIERLRGVGYGGWVTMDVGRAENDARRVEVGGDPAGVEEFLADSIGKLKKWAGQ